MTSVFQSCFGDKVLACEETNVCVKLFLCECLYISELKQRERAKGQKLMMVSQTQPWPPGNISSWNFTDGHAIVTGLQLNSQDKDARAG